MLTAGKRHNITVSLDQSILRKAKVLAAKRSTSVSGLLAEQIAAIVGEDEAYELAQRQALELMETGFHLGGHHVLDRDALHDR